MKVCVGYSDLSIFVVGCALVWIDQGRPVAVYIKDVSCRYHQCSHLFGCNHLLSHLHSDGLHVGHRYEYLCKL